MSVTLKFQISKEDLKRLTSGAAITIDLSRNGGTDSTESSPDKSAHVAPKPGSPLAIKSKVADSESSRSDSQSSPQARKPAAKKPANSDDSSEKPTRKAAESESSPATKADDSESPPAKVVKKAAKKATPEDSPADSSSPVAKKKGKATPEDSPPQKKGKAAVSPDSPPAKKSKKDVSEDSSPRKQSPKKASKKSDDSDASEPPEKVVKNPIVVVNKPKGMKDWEPAPDYYTFAKGTNYIVFEKQVVGAWSAKGIRELTATDNKGLKEKGWNFEKQTVDAIKKNMKSLR